MIRETEIKFFSDDSVTIIAQGHAALNLETGAGDDEVMILARGWVQRLDIGTGIGDDVVTVDMVEDAVFYDLRIWTGWGRDHVLLRAESELSQPRYESQAIIMTEAGEDVVQFEGAYLGGMSVLAHLGAGDDMLLGDPDCTLPDEYPMLRVEAIGADGHDTVLNASYFSWLYLAWFESVED